MTSRRSIFKRLACALVGGSAVAQPPIPTDITDAEIRALLQEVCTAREDPGCDGPWGPPGPIGSCGHQGPCDCPIETEEEHLARWRATEEHNRRYYERHPE